MNDFFFFFFFSSRRRHTRWTGDWSSDVCSSDLFRSLGTPAEPGSMLVTLIGAVRRPGVYEIEIGRPVREVLELAGGPEAPLSALLIGGYFGTWADPAAAEPLP